MHGPSWRRSAMGTARRLAWSGGPGIRWTSSCEGPRLGVLARRGGTAAALGPYTARLIPGRPAAGHAAWRATMRGLAGTYGLRAGAQLRPPLGLVTKSLQAARQCARSPSGRHRAGPGRQRSAAPAARQRLDSRYVTAPVRVAPFPRNCNRHVSPTCVHAVRSLPPIDGVIRSMRHCAPTTDGSVTRHET